MLMLIGLQHGLLARVGPAPGADPLAGVDRLVVARGGVPHRKFGEPYRVFLNARRWM
jgi:hypothetical protein